MKTRTKWTISSSTSQKPLDTPADMIPLRKTISLTGPTFAPPNGNGHPQKLVANTGPPPRSRRAVTTVGGSKSPLHSTTTVFDPVRKTVSRSMPPVSAAAKSDTSLLLPKRPATNNYDPLNMRQYFSRNRKPGNGSDFHHHNKDRTPLTIKDAPKKAPRFKSTSPYATLENLSKSTVFLSETKQSFRKSNSEQHKRNQRAATYNNQQHHHHSAGRSASWNSVRPSQIPKPSSVRQISDGISEVNSWTRERHESKKTNYESDKMKTSRSELSLLEQKKLQWAKEREELNGLWSPWGRQPDSSNSLSPAAMQAQVSYPSPTNVVTSSYVANLGIGPGVYSPSCSESCYLPPINSTIAQQPRQKAKVWNNTEFQPEDYRYENDSGQNHHPNRSALQTRKASLPNYMFESGDGYHNGNNNYHHHQQMVLQQHGKMDEPHYNSNSNLRASSMDEDAFTSGYYSENNNNNNGDEQNGQVSKELLLKPTSRERTYQEEITVQKAVSHRGEHNASPRVIVHKIYAQNGELIAEQEDGREVIVNTMVMSNSTGRGDGNSRLGDYTNHNHQHYESSHSPCGNLPRNHAMRSSLTIGVDARTVDAYSEIDRREKEQWLIELEKQREEQRMRKLMEKEERRPRWGDRGIGVGHFWEPSDSENSHLPAPPQTSRVKGGGGGGPGVTISSSRGVEEENGDGESYSTHHQGQSHTPPAWLEKGLTRMQSSKSQPCLHDPEFIHDLDRVYTGMEDTGGSNNNNISSSRSLNHSAIDLRNVVGYNSPTYDPQTDRTFTRGQNVPIDLDTYTEMEKKRLANQEHLEALKKQIEERQQKQKEEKERLLQEDREHEMRIARQRELELQRLEMEKRGKGPINGDMPNCIEENTSTEHSKVDMSSDPKSSKISAMLERSNISIHDSDEQKDIEIVQRQSVMVVTATAPSTDLGEEEGKTTNTEGSDSSKSHLRHHHHNQHRLSRQDQSVMTDMSDTMCERTLTPSMQRSRSLSLCRSSREFGTQTELSDGSSSTSSSSGSLRGSGKNNDMTRSHNSLLDKKKGKEKAKQEKKAEERPRWGSNPVKKQYVKQSEKDPNYISRMKRRQERLKRMEDERSVRGDNTGTESEDVSIPFHRIRQRRNEPSPQRRTRGIAPMKATHYTKTDKDEMILKSCSSSLQQEESVDEDTGRQPPPPRSMRAPHDVPYPHSNMKSSKSETQLTKQKTAEMLDRNFGSIAGVNVTGTSEESSGFSTPFLARRELGSGSTGSGTTGSGSGVQSPDLAYHTYQASKSTREEQNFARITSGRDSHAPVTTSRAHISSSGNKINTSITSSEFSSTQKGFIHQREFDEIPIKPSKSFKEEDVAKVGVNSVNSTSNERVEIENPLVSRSRKPSGFDSKQRNKSVSPKRKVSPVKVAKFVDEKNKHEMGADNQRRMSLDNLNLPEIHQSPRLTSPPVPALFKKLQMGLQPDESGRISCLPTEFPDILTPLPTIPIGSLMSPNPSRLSSAASSAGSRIDIDIAVTPRGNPEIMKLFEAAEERIKQRQLNAILQSNNGGAHESDSARSRTSFEADVGSISINLEPVMLYPSRDPNGVEKTEIEIPTSARLSIRSHPLEGSSRRAPPVSARDEDLAAKHGAFIASILNRKEVKEQLSARESELSEKGIIEFSIRLPSTSASGDGDQVDEYRDPLLTERRRHTAQWLYGGQSVPQKQAILTNLASLKKGISMQQQEWKVGNSDTE